MGGKEQETDLTCSFDPLLQEFHYNIKLWCIKWQRCIITPWGGAMMSWGGGPDFVTTLILLFGMPFFLYTQDLDLGEGWE